MLDATPLQTTITFRPTAQGAELRWESEVIGVRTSIFSTPYHNNELDLVLRALNLVQYPGYRGAFGDAAPQQLRFTAAEQQQLATLGLCGPDGLVFPDAPRRVGRALLAALTADRNGGLALGLTRDFANGSGRPFALALRFPPAAVALAALPWELLWGDEPTPLLFARGRVGSCTRHLDLDQPIPSPRSDSGPLQVLAIAPNAGITPLVRLAERAARRVAWGGLIEEGQVQMREICPATRPALLDAFESEQPPDIVHFYGHGRYTESGGALLIDGDRGGVWLGVERLMTLLGGVRMVVLHACQGAAVSGRTTTTPSLLSGVAPALSAAGVPVVIGMQLTVRSMAATRASGTIYRALAAGASVQQAVSRARQTLYVEEEDQVSWFVPVLYIRAHAVDEVYLHTPGAVSAVEAEPARPTPTPTAGARQSISAHANSNIRNVQLHAAPGAVQTVSAREAGQVEHARVHAQRASTQELSAEAGGTITNVELNDMGTQPVSEQ